MIRLLRRLAWAAVLLTAVALVGAWLLLRASLPQLDGEYDAGSAQAPVTLERDALGTPTVTGADRAALAYGLGFAHAQDRFFQMDLARRLAAGELSELFGRIALETDRKARLFRFRRVARDVVAVLTPAERAVMDGYVRGVNDGLASLGSRPWEYWLLRSVPEPWRDEDSILVVHSMWWQLQYQDFAAEQRRQSLDDALTTRLGAERAAAVLAFLLPAETAWDAPAEPDAPPPALLAIPGPDLWTMPRSAAPVARVAANRGIGSNNWALAGAHTASGSALVANDMHLGLDVPPVWYRARLRTPDGRYDLTGVTLAGVPALVAGSNGHIAWGFTNSYGDWLDLRWTRCDPDAGTYRDLGGRESRLETERTRIRVKGGPPERMQIRRGAEGIVFATRKRGGVIECQLATWIATQPLATTLGIFALETATTVEEALAVAPTVGIPQQNMLVGDRAGHIAWTLLGRIPRTRGPLRAAGGDYIDPALQPRIIDPPSGRLWSANARVVSGPMGVLIGDDEVATGVGYDLGARAGQIRDDLAALRQPAKPADMLAIQLDDRAQFLAPWRQLYLDLLDAAALAGQPHRAGFRRLVAAPMPRADADSVAYALVRTAQQATVNALWSAVLAGAGLEPGAFSPPPQFAATAWQLVTARPANWLPPPYADWRAFLIAQLDRAAVELAQECGELSRCSWGRARPVRIAHPLSGALPLSGHFLDMRVPPLPGDHDMPRVQGQAFGASERFAVSPGREAEAYLEIPGGPSGHPLSPFYRAGFDDWAQGVPTPFLPGPPRHKLILQ
ncbi:MAG TPA: penicillin acylase family protein [Steroidobacteraceae bacterium]|nr:penicillin acylase family protein [Steroidobacteraceae bacterium]HQX79367.1 penicillin acylase family protein [Steroidobacteraceae bacterium]